MNLIDETFEAQKDKNESKRTLTLILVFMAIIVVAIIAIVFSILYLKNKELKLYIDGIENEKVKDMMVVEGKTVYFPIKDIAPYFNYSSYNGEYIEKSEETNKCYVECEDEAVNFSLNSDKIYTLIISDKNQQNKNYDYFYADKPVKSINGRLYVSSDAIERAFNVVFKYDDKTQRAYFFTMETLCKKYEARVLDSGYENIAEEYVNRKAVLKDMIVVNKDGKKIYAVIDTQGKHILEAKYEYIEYLPNSGNFIVKSDGKVGIMSAKRKTIIPIEYDSLELIDSDAELYLAGKDRKFGIIDSKGIIKVHAEYDEIGIDLDNFAKNDIKNRYLLDNGMILARKDKLWGAFNKNGETIVDFTYDSFGYITSNDKDGMNLLLIPDYNILVACKNKKYTLINKSGNEIISPIIDDVYMKISGGKKYYYMYVADQEYDLEELFKQQGIRRESDKSSKNSDDNQSTNKNTTQETTEEEDENEIEQEEQEAEEEQVQEEETDLEEQVIEEEQVQEEYQE